jgi:hypothetical protein
MSINRDALCAPADFSKALIGLSPEKPTGVSRPGAVERANPLCHSERQHLSRQASCFPAIWLLHSRGGSSAGLSGIATVSGRILNESKRPGLNRPSRENLCMIS